MRTELQSFAINSNFAVLQQLQSARPGRLEVTVSKKSNQFGRDDDVMIERASSYEYVVPRRMDGYRLG
jgi:hypothetical protein